MDNLQKLGYDAFRLTSDNKDSNGKELKEYDDLTSAEKKGWEFIVSVIEEKTRLSIAQKQIDDSIATRLKQLKQQA